RNFRKHATWYTKGFPGSTRLRDALIQIESLAELREILDRIDPEIPFPAHAMRLPRGKRGGTQRVALPDGYLDDLGDATPPAAGRVGGGGGRSGAPARARRARSPPAPRPPPPRPPPPPPGKDWGRPAARRSSGARASRTAPELRDSIPTSCPSATKPGMSRSKRASAPRSASRIHSGSSASIRAGATPSL